MTKSSRQAAIAGYLKRDDGIDWKGLTDYANSMYDVRDELEIAEVEDNFDSETAQKAIKSKTPYLTLRPLQINPAEFRKDLQKLQDAFIEKGVINVDEQVAKLKALDWNKLTDATIKLAGEDPTAFYEVATKEVLGEEADEDMMAVIAGLLHQHFFSSAHQHPAAYELAAIAFLHQIVYIPSDQLIHLFSAVLLHRFVDFQNNAFRIDDKNTIVNIVEHRFIVFRF